MFGATHLTTAKEKQTRFCAKNRGITSEGQRQRCKLYELCSGPHMFRLPLRYASLIYSPTNSTCTFVHALRFQDTIPMFVPFYCVRKKKPMNIPGTFFLSH